ncbi:hypothetical protein [Vibrio sp. B1Z05]|uniref:hypothetical protein n=1 Tax=Vibrio sp. B1Z05 TaxID=2654980 RepID=UPI00128D0C6D|nr:hypothetical protein [Vibrio sp. B1Z05]MPW35581.1 hypothetical protein [Vibrio sp. B1Z05]
MINHLKKTIESKLVVKHQDNKVEFYESEEDALLKKVVFSVSNFLREGGGLLKNAVIIEGDSSIEDCLRRFTFYLNDTCPDITRQCDYIVFHEAKDSLRIMLIEMKSSDTSVDLEARIHKQFQFSKIFAKYLIDVTAAYVEIADGVLAKPITYHKIALVKADNVAMSLPLGKPPQKVAQLPSSESNGIKSLFLNTDRHGVAKLDWRYFMENI